MKKHKLYFLILFLFYCNHLYSYKLDMGIGTVASQSIYKGVDNKIFAVPIINYRYKKIYFSGLETGINMLQTNYFQIDAIINYDMSGYKPKDSSFLRDMSEKESSLFAGIKLKSKNLLKKVDLDFVLLKDIMNKSKGIKSNLILGHNFIVNNKIIFLINGGVSYLNNDYSKYYFGVSNNEIINERNYYNPGTVFRTSLKVGLNYRMAEKLNLLILLNYENLSDKLSNSPIVRQENIFSGLLGFIYNIN